MEINWFATHEGTVGKEMSVRKPAWFHLQRACGCLGLGKSRVEQAAKAAEFLEHPCVLQELPASPSQGKGKGRKQASANAGRMDSSPPWWW